MEVQGAGVIHVSHFSVVVNFTSSASLAVGSGVVGWLKSFVLPSLLLLGSLKLCASLLWSDGWDFRHPLSCSLSSASSVGSSSPTFRCANVLNYLRPCCAGQRHIC